MKLKWKKFVSVLLIAAFMVLSVSDLSGSSIVAAAENNSVTIHFKSTWNGANIFYWNQNGGYNNPVKWPGSAMTSEGDGWYAYTFENTQKITFMFQYDGKQTTHYTKTTGNYWLENNQWFDHKPDETEITPKPTEKPTATPKVTATGKPTATAVPTAAPTVTLLPTRAVTPTSAPEVTLPASDQTITVHFNTEQQSAKMFYWNVNYGTNTPVTWPGVDMVFEGNNWYGYTIENAKSANIVLVTENGETEEVSVVAGEWWYANGELMDYNPYGDIIVTTAPTAQPTATLVPSVTSGADVTIAPTVSVEPTVTTEPTITAEVTATAAPTATEAAIATATPKPPVKGKIIVHFYSNSASMNIHYWDAVGAAKTTTAWPGDAMTPEGNNWYTYTIEGATSASMLFNCNANKETGDLSQTEGEWWYKAGKWTDIDPNGPTPTPGPTNTPRPTNTPTPTWDPSKPTPTPVSGAERGEDWDFRDETIYFVMTTRFYDGDPGNNVSTWRDSGPGGVNPESDPGWRGDFKGLIEKLDYIKALGFTAIWMTPVVKNASDYDHHGYHAINHSVVDVRYESEGATYQDLINACHAKGIKVIQDVVLNHCSEYGEENLYPLYTRSDNLEDLATQATAIKVTSYGESKGLSSSSPREDRLNAMKNDETDPERIFHHEKSMQWEGYTVQTAQMGDNCVDLNTENPVVTEYLKNCYVNYINMGVDAFRMDTVKHVSRLSYNNGFLPFFQEAGGDDFFMFGEACVLRNEVWNDNKPAISVPFYTWKESKDYGWRSDKTLEATLNNEQLAFQLYEDQTVENQPTSTNAFLDGNNYHQPDYSQFSGMGMIDFYMHHQFANAYAAFGVAKQEDSAFNDSTWNVMYVDSHDYGPNNDGGLRQRYAGGTQAWAENLNLMFTFRGIPCIYYGSEIEFKKGLEIDAWGSPLENSGRAYFGDHLEGSVTATGFGEYTNASGEIANTLDYPLVKHIQRLNKIRAAIPALRKGQYSTENVNGGLAYKRRYTNDKVGIDSFVCVTITDGATFSKLPGGTYVDAVTGDKKTIGEGGTLTIDAPGKGNMRVYVLDTGKGSISGAIGSEIDGPYLK